MHEPFVHEPFATTPGAVVPPPSMNSRSQSPPITRIPNPRGISTVLFLALRKVLGRFASLPIRALLGVFGLLGKLPSRSVTGCFLAVGAVKERP